MVKSKTIMSGFNSLAITTASLPFAASPHTLQSGFCSISVLRAFRRGALSSAIRNRTNKKHLFPKVLLFSVGGFGRFRSPFKQGLRNRPAGVLRFHLTFAPCGLQYSKQCTPAYAVQKNCTRAYQNRSVRQRTLCRESPPC